MLNFMLKNYNHTRRLCYLLFTIAFGFVWYLFKLGGIPKPLLALVSAAIDISFSLAALIITVELLLPRFFYQGRYGLFALCFFAVIIITGSSTIELQLKLFGHSINDYGKSISRYKEHYYYWFWSDLVCGSYFLISFIALGGFAIRLSFDRIIGAKRMETLEKERSQAEIEMLKNQINPHFLFNALNTIYYKIERVNSPARLMVEKFSSMLGKTDLVKPILETYPNLMTAKGPHGFTLLHHAKVGGKDAEELYSYLQEKGMKDDWVKLR